VKIGLSGEHIRKYDLDALPNNIADGQNLVFISGAVIRNEQFFRRRRPPQLNMLRISRGRHKSFWFPQSGTGRQPPCMPKPETRGEHCLAEKGPFMDGHQLILKILSDKISI